MSGPDTRRIEDNNRVSSRKSTVDSLVTSNLPQGLVDMQTGKNKDSERKTRKTTEERQEEKQVKKEEKAEERQERISNKNDLLQRVKEKIGVYDLERTSATDFMKSFYKLKNNQLIDFYVILQQDGTGTLSNYIKNNLSLDQKVDVLEKISDSSILGKDDIFQKRTSLIDKLKIEKKEFLKNLILNKYQTDKSNIDKQIYQIQKYFIASDIIKEFGYNFSQIKDNLLTLSLKDREENPKNYDNLTSLTRTRDGIGIYKNETVTRFFIRKMLIAGQDLEQKIFEKKDENGEKIFSEEKSRILWEYASKGGCFIGLVNSLISLNDRQLNKLNSLTNDGFIRVLENISNNEAVKSNIKNITNYEVKEINASEIAYLIDIEDIVETQISDFVYDLKKNGNLDKHQDYANALELAKQDFAKELFLSSRSNIDRDSLPFERKQVYIEKWNDLSKEQQDKRVSARLVSLISNSSYLAVQTSARYSEMRESEIAATRIMQTQSYLERSVSNMNISEEEKARMLLQISQQAENSNKQLFESAQEYGFTQDLRQVRGEEYYKKIESESKIMNSTAMLEKKIDITTKSLTKDKDSWNDFKDRIKGNSALGENRIKEIKGLEDGSLQEEEEKNIVLASTNNQLKQTFVNRMLFFLQDSLDINIDSQNTENILSQFSLDKDQKFDNQNVFFKGNFKGQNIELKYDMSTGSLSYKPFLSKQEDSIGIFTTDFVPFKKELIGPSIQEITSICEEKINCKEILDKSKNDMQKYSQIFGRELEYKYPPKLVENKDSIKEDYLKTIVAQEMVDLTQETVLPMYVDKNNGKQRHEFYKMIYENIYQSEENNSINKLQELRESIKTMKEEYDKITNTPQIKEKFSFSPKSILKKLFDKRIIDKDQNIVDKDNKIEMWNCFFDNVSDKKNGKNIINTDKIKLFMKGVSNNQERNIVIDSVSESMRPFFDEDLDSELIRQYNLA